MPTKSENKWWAYEKMKGIEFALLAIGAVAGAFLRYKKNDELHGKKLEHVILEFLVNAGIAGATVWTGVNGFGKRGKSTVKIEGLTMNMPLMLEVVDAKEKLEPLLPQLKRMVNDNGLVTLHGVEIL